MPTLQDIHHGCRPPDAHLTLALRACDGDPERTRHHRGLGASPNIVIGGLLGRARAATALRFLLRRRRCRCREDELLAAARSLGSGAASTHSPSICVTSVEWRWEGTCGGNLARSP